MEGGRTPSRVPPEEAAGASSPGGLAMLPPSQVDDLLGAERRKDEFLAALSHELRSPLGAIQNAVGVLKGAAVQDLAVQQRMHALIERQVHHMQQLTADLLDISGISRGQLHLQLDRIDLRGVLQHAVETMEWELQQRGHRLVIQCPDTPVWLQGDATRLQQVLDNLLANASKYTEPGGELALSLRVRDGIAILNVRDSGIGIAAETLPHIFDLYVRADPQAQQSGGSLGIGLALVRKLVEMHGGSVAAVSAGVGQGSEFCVRLPLSAD
jgi:signal transduction histidine kinase